ncbi:alpha-amylase family glycosyl hydrolase [Arthrobacter sp. AL08]|uniref:alpha-amylase family glycosyl hydrolase n=1 Tax=Micrococcaceae TaxID=1268 RepID=UPI00249C7640|nr:MULTISPECIES: alpha-amylase family glycosyl hydrolase [Micrococcaceae]MDI3242234.1 alpha-amylase family glycosyl hydrolase [Arthrobacter sp. AL05]MDI3278160.1 alpha-amylase family glycosyl hydrolase [Arthrobacter sp. AL08]MDJ0353172.1 alpha-amylase family glycosyl hydrolase [Pseudarthrobacter sp. PH31-O2]
MLWIDCAPSAEEAANSLSVFGGRPTLFKADGLPDSPSTGGVVDGLRSNPQVSDQEEVHEVYRRWRTLAEKYEPHRLLVGEVNLEPARAARYTRADEMQQAFAFAFVKLGWDPEAWAAVGNDLEAARQLHGATPTWALENRDIVRSVTRFGGGEVGALRARASLVALLGLPGPAYLYQGQELGLPEVDVPLESRVDPMWARGGVCRDGARVPLPWTADAALSHGFSFGGTCRGTLAADPGGLGHARDRTPAAGPRVLAGAGDQGSGAAPAAVEDGSLCRERRRFVARRGRQPADL